MGVTDKVWETFAKVIKMDDKVERLANSVVKQQDKIENLTERVIRLEAALEIALHARGTLSPSAQQSLQNSLSGNTHTAVQQTSVQAATVDGSAVQTDS